LDAYYFFLLYRLWRNFSRNFRFWKARRSLRRLRARCYDFWSLCRLYGAYRAFWARFWFWRGFRGRLWSWFYGSHRVSRYRLRLNWWSRFDNWFLYLVRRLRRFWTRFNRWLRIHRGRSNIIRMVKQSRVQLSAVRRYNTNKNGEATSKAPFAIVLSDVPLVQKVIVFIVPPDLKCLLCARFILASN
jgi:hypothetical protein